MKVHVIVMLQTSRSNFCFLVTIQDMFILTYTKAALFFPIAMHMHLFIYVSKNNTTR